MKSIRSYIDMIDRELNEGFFGSRQKPAQPAPVFHPNQSDLRTQIDIAKRYATAEEYAEDMNRYGHGATYDPNHVKSTAQQEENRLIRQWNSWKEQGLI